MKTFFCILTSIVLLVIGYAAVWLWPYSIAAGVVVGLVIAALTVVVLEATKPQTWAWPPELHK